MTESMDIAFVMADTSLRDPFFPNVKHMVLSIINPLLQQNYDIRFRLIKFNSGNGIPTISTVYPFTDSSEIFQQWLRTGDDGAIGANTQNITICDALREALNSEWRTGDSNRCHENVVFLVTDNVPCPYLLNTTDNRNYNRLCACDNLWTISNAFVKKNITLMVVGVGQITSICDSLYGSIAKNTGGEYIPLINAIHVLHLVLQSILIEGDTLLQALRHIKQEEFERNSSYCCSVIQIADSSSMKHRHIAAWLPNHLQ
ncbi:unnamed protein product [Adineta steineri]|uniref:VWFA domain-containing protein n=1 Tax=Adineta steineri TaxID=433720 RepID=A0A813QLW5_9BILA|nr:unnamed protein product [Adineta steineri]CAF0769413.1 unnamed protein product [Adineta steineri]